MGCGNSKEKVEDEMLKMKMQRIELQMERYRQLQRLKEIDGCDRKAPVIPDYIDPNFNNNNSNSTINKNNNTNLRRRPIRSKSTKAFVLKNSNKIFNFDEEEKNITKIRKGKRRTTRKRKTTIKY